VNARSPAAGRLGRASHMSCVAIQASEPFSGTSRRASYGARRYCFLCVLRTLEIVVPPMGGADRQTHVCDRHSCDMVTCVSVTKGPGNGAQARFPDRTVIKREAARARLARDDRSASTHSVAPTSCMSADQPSVLAICGNPWSAARAAC
jgi:hypothetical protein